MELVLPAILVSVPEPLVHVWQKLGLTGLLDTDTLVTSVAAAAAASNRLSQPEGITPPLQQLKPSLLLAPLTLY